MDQQPTQSPASTPAQQPQPYRRNYFIALGISIFIGEFGVDRFYMGKIGTGFLKLITIGGLGVWWIIDIVLIASGNMRDKNGNTLTRKFDVPE